MRFILILVLCLVMAATAQAGAWLRETGSTFSSSSFTLNWLGDQSRGAYLEYGFRDNLTVGADLSFDTSYVGSQTGKITLFFRRSLGRGEGPNAWAYEIGAGAAWTDQATLPHAKLGLSWGRGFQFRDKSGWMGVDSALFLEGATGHHVIKIDGTLGLHFSDRTTGMVQIYLSRIDENNFGKFAPSVVFKPKWSNFRFQVGIETPFDAPRMTSLKLGLWREF